MMDLKHCEFITGCSSLVEVHGRLFQAIATNFSFKECYSSNENLCSYVLEKTSTFMDYNEAATACYELTVL